VLFVLHVRVLQVRSESVSGKAIAAALVDFALEQLRTACTLRRSLRHTRAVVRTVESAHPYL
jgi:hypothetical protein